MDGSKDVRPIDQESEFKKVLFQIAKQLKSNNVKDLIHFFDEIPKGDRQGIKNGLQLMEVLLRLDQVSYKNTEKLKRNLDRIGRKNLVEKLVSLEEELDNLIKISTPQDKDSNTEEASQLIENDGSSDAKGSRSLNTKEGKDMKDGNDKINTIVDNDEEMTNNENENDEKPWDEEQKDSDSDSDSDNEVYPMDANPCGKCLIINNNFEDHKGAEPRFGSNVDEKKLSDVFKYLNFEIEVLRNLPKDKLFEQLNKEMLDKRKQMHNAFVLCILTYGKGDTLCSYDGGMCSTQEIIEMFANKNCEHLKGKPKFFFIQSCHIPCKKDNNISYNGIFPETDQVVWFGSSPGSYRSQDGGSWFIRTCCELLKKGARKKRNLSDINRNLSNTIGDEMKKSNEKCIFKTFGDNNLRGIIQFCPKKSK